MRCGRVSELHTGRIEHGRREAVTAGLQWLSDWCPLPRASRHPARAWERDLAREGEHANPTTSTLSVQCSRPAVVSAAGMRGSSRAAAKDVAKRLRSSEIHRMKEDQQEEVSSSKILGEAGGGG